MGKRTLMIFAHPDCRKASKVSFQKLDDNDKPDLERGLGKVLDQLEEGIIVKGQVINLYGYVHESDNGADDDNWDLTTVKA